MTCGCGCGSPGWGDIAARHHGDVLDAGRGEGLLVQRLAAVSHRAIGIDPDPAAVQRAQRRLHSTRGADRSIAVSVVRGILNLLHETPSPSSDWTARQPHARGWLG